MDPTPSTSMHPDISTSLAFERTRLAYERTMMAWVRTATALITFGFTVYKFFQVVRGEVGREHGLIGPREFALSMIVIGLFSLLLATLEHRWNTQTLRAQYPGIRRSLAAVVAALVAILGILAMIAVILRQ